MNTTFVCFAGFVVCVVVTSCGRGEGQPDERTQLASQLTPAQSTDTSTRLTASRFTREQVLAARKKYKVDVLSFDGSQQFGTEFPYSDLVRIRITNGSEIALPALTVLTKRFGADGTMIGSSRAPSIPVADLKPRQIAEIDYYPKGHLPGVTKIRIEIEQLIDPNVAQFFPELPK